METEENLIIKIYSFTMAEQEAFPYTRKYMSRIKPQLYKVMQDPVMRERFMLVGLFVTYRAFRHYGDIMTTDLDVLTTYDETMHVKRLREFKRITGQDIKNAAHYLHLVKFNIFKVSLSYIIGLDLVLYMFVTHGW